MKGRLIIYSATEFDCTIKEYDHPIPLSDLKAAVGGYIETVPMWNKFKFGEKIERAVMFCNEDGKNLGLPPNLSMTVLWRAELFRMLRLRTDDILVGSIAVVMGDDEFMDSL